VQDDAERIVPLGEARIERDHFLGRAHGVVMAPSPKTDQAERPQG
jgi:hypothetical protein